MDDATFPSMSSLNPEASTSTLSSFALDPTLASAKLALDPALWSDEHESSAQEGNPGLSSSDDSVGDDDDYSTESDETDAEEELAKAQATQDKKRTRTNDKGKGRETELDVDGPAFDDGEELGRLISAIRESDQPTSGGRSALEKEFDRAIEDELEQIDTRGLFAGTVKGKQKKHYRAGGRRAAADIEPSKEVRSLLGEANRLYAIGELDQAIDIFSDVVRIDPTIKAPWFTLATIWDEKGDKEKSIMFKIVGTHLGGSRQSAQDWATLGGESRDIGLLQQSIYCFTQAIKLDKNDVDSMWDRAVLLKLSGSHKQAIKAFTAILAVHPHDPGVLRELTPLLASTNAHARAMTLLLDAYNYTRASYPQPTQDDIASFDPSDLESLADFLTQQLKYKDCVRVVKEGLRWMQGRADEKGWDKMGDDREFDEQRKVREGWEEQARFLEEAPVYEMDVRLRVRLGVARMGLNHVEEAQRHFTIVRREDVAELPELYGAVADACFNRKLWSDALDVYQDMAEDEDANGPKIWTKIAECNEKMGDFEAAKECYEAVIEEETDNLNARFALARCWEQMGDPAQALKIIREVLEMRRKQRSTGARVRRMPELFKVAHSLTESTATKRTPQLYDIQHLTELVNLRQASALGEPRESGRPSQQPFNPDVLAELRYEAMAYQDAMARAAAEAAIRTQARALEAKQAKAMRAVAAKPRREPQRVPNAKLQSYIDRVAAMSVEDMSAAEQQAVENDLAMAEELVAEGVDQEDANEALESGSFVLDPETRKAPKVPRMNRAVRSSLTAVDREAREMERRHEFTLAMKQLEILSPAVDAGDEGARSDWLSVATYLVDSFRETRQLFPADGKRKFVGMTRDWKRKGGEDDTLEGAADQMEDRLLRQLDEPATDPNTPLADLPEVHEFRGLDFDGWLKLILKYAFLLTQNDEIEAGQETLEHVLYASPFKSYPHRLNSIRLARIACYLHVGNITAIVPLARTIILQNQFQTDALRLLQALVPSGQSSVEVWNTSTLQKFTIRQLRLIDDVARGKPHKVGNQGQLVLMGEHEEDDGEEPRGPLNGAKPKEGMFKPTKTNPVYLTAYAGMLLTSRSFQSAIIYLLRALEQAPDQPVILLTLGVTYLHRAMSRQSDNREHQIAQAFAFLSQYREKVGPGQEAEYNFGRAFHQLGLNAYAVRHYEQCLTYAVADRLAATSLMDTMAVDGGEGDDGEEKEYDDYGKVAAYNLSTLYMLLGQAELAKAVADRWLAV